MMLQAMGHYVKGIWARRLRRSPEEGDEGSDDGINAIARYGYQVPDGEKREESMRGRTWCFHAKILA
jgi:hypothetical protein